MPGFDYPFVLLALAGIPVVYYFYKLALSRKKKGAMLFSNVSFLKSVLGTKKVKKVNYLFYLSLLAVALMVIGFSGPHIPLSRAKKGVNVVLAIDVSGSMQAKDYKPTRLDAAKKAAAILIKSLKPNDDVGIVIFQSGATTAAYLSPYKDRVLKKLFAIKPSNGATAIGDGLSLAIDMATSIPNKKRVVILLSDGVNNAGVISPDEAIRYAKANHIQVYTIGLGSNKKVVLGYDWFGNPQYAELDEKTLKKIAYETGGKYFKSVDSHTLNEIYRNIGKSIKREKEETDISRWFFFGALIVMLIEIYYRYGRGWVIQ